MTPRQRHDKPALGAGGIRRAMSDSTNVGRHSQDYLVESNSIMSSSEGPTGEVSKRVYNSSYGSVVFTSYRIGRRSSNVSGQHILRYPSWGPDEIENHRLHLRLAAEYRLQNTLSEPLNRLNK